MSKNKDSAVQPADVGGPDQRVWTRYGRSPGVIASQFSEGLASRLMRWSRHTHFPHTLRRRGLAGYSFSDLLYRQRRFGESSPTTDAQVATGRLSESTSPHKPLLQRLSAPAAGSRGPVVRPLAPVQGRRSAPLQRTVYAAPPLTAENPIFAQRSPSPGQSPAGPISVVVQRQASGSTPGVGRARAIEQPQVSKLPALAHAEKSSLSTPSLALRRQISMVQTGISAVRRAMSGFEVTHPGGAQTTASGAKPVTLTGTRQLISRRMRPSPAAIRATGLYRGSAVVTQASRSIPNDLERASPVIQEPAPGTASRAAAQDGPMQRKVGKFPNQLQSVGASALSPGLERQRPLAAGDQMVQAASGRTAVGPQARTEPVKAASAGESSKDEQRQRQDAPILARSSPVAFRVVLQDGPDEGPVQRKMGTLAARSIGVRGPALGQALQKRYRPKPGISTAQSATSRLRRRMIHSRFAPMDQFPPAAAGKEPLPIIEGAPISPSPPAPAGKEPLPIVEGAPISSSPAGEAAKSNAASGFTAGGLSQTPKPTRPTVQTKAQTDTPQRFTPALQSQGTKDTGSEAFADSPVVYVQGGAAARPASTLIQASALVDFPFANPGRSRTGAGAGALWSAPQAPVWFAGGSEMSTMTAVQRTAETASQPSPIADMPETGTGEASAAGPSSLIQADMDELELERLADKIYRIIQQRLIFEREIMGL